MRGFFAPMDSPPSSGNKLVLAEVTRVGDLLDYDWGDWLDPLMLAQRMGLSRPCTPQRILQEKKKKASAEMLLHFRLLPTRRRCGDRTQQQLLDS
ncbi:hypothetical protein UY3_10800 [Chelonia mydas]|uniref:Uncharacterized protein n=1 Tax=Chelonia mydas TaxID=8469 RepID=M7B948_CHEMY|nr:hypothetical protein UY3_10800 [Chelonia mydas]